MRSLLEPAVETAEEAAEQPRPSLRGRSHIAASAGDSVSALNAEISTEIAIVMANCLLRRPWMPPMKATGMKTDARISAMLTTGPETSSIALQRRVARRHPFLDVVLHRLDDDDGVVHDEADREHEAEERQRVHREAEQPGTP